MMPWTSNSIINNFKNICKQRDGMLQLVKQENFKYSEDGKDMFKNPSFTYKKDIEHSDNEAEKVKNIIKDYFDENKIKYIGRV